MTGSRMILGNEDRTKHRRRLLGGAIAAQVLTIGVAAASLLIELPLPIELASCVLAIAAVVGAMWLVVLLGRDDERGREHAEAAIDLSSSLLIALDRRGCIRMANPAACEALCRSEQEMLGRRIHELLIAEHELDASRAAFARLLAGDIDPDGYRVVRTMVRPDGAERHISWHVAARRGDDGGVRGLLVSGEDVTDQVRREAMARDEALLLEQLRHLARDVAATDDARQPIVDRVRDMLGAGFVTLAEPTDDGFAFTANTLEALTGVTIGRDEASGCAVVARTHEALVVPDAVGDPRVNPRMLAATGCVSIRYEPVLGADGLAGVLIIGWLEPTAVLDSRSEQFLALAADETAIALKRVETLRHLKTIALTDTLTGIANRRAFDGEIGRAIARARRDGRDLALLVMDLNEFKALNDRHGHDVGDALLAACAGSWEAELRGGDVLARLGGDEFAAVLADADAAAAAAAVERLRAVTPHKPGASFGYAVWSGESAHELYQLADRALYRDKARRREGRIADPARVAAVEAAAPWAGEAPEAIEAIAAEARDLLDLPNVYVNLVGEHEMRHVARPAADPITCRRTSESYCQHVVASGRPFVVSDAADEPAMRGNPIVELARAYAGMPLADEDGNVLGALCAVDEHPREWDATELRVLDRLAERASRELTAAAPARR